MIERHYAGILALSCLMVGLIVGFGAGWQFYHPHSLAAVETYKPAVRQQDGSLVLERKPIAGPADPPHEIPKGAKVERQISVVVRPTTRVSADGAGTAGAQGTRATSTLHPDTPSGVNESPASTSRDGAPCPDVSLDLSLVRNEDKSTSVVASSKDGTVIGGTDVLRIPGTVARDPKWNVSYLQTFDGKKGGYVQRKIWGPFNAGVGAVPGTQFITVGATF